MLSKKRLLIVDDDSSLSISISSYLISEGFQVSLANDVKDALYQMKNYKPDMVISDVMMPYIDGYDFLQMLRLDESFFKIPVILLTAKGMTQDRIKGYDLGCNAYLAKPFDPNELLSMINNLFKNINLLNVQPSTYNSLVDCDLCCLFDKDLTNRELTILSLLVKGYTNKEIANHLQISVRNVEKYVSRLLNKTSTRNRTELAQRAISCRVKFLEGE